MPKKVFELAKEMDLGAIELVDKLKTLGFDVRNHMVVLSDDDVTKAMEALAPKVAEPAKKKKVAKKKATKKKVTKKKVVKKVLKTKDDPGSSDDNAEVNDTAADKKKVVTRKKKVITRKANDLEAEEANKTVSEEAANSGSEELYKEPAQRGLEVVSEAPAKKSAESTGSATATANTEKVETAPGVFKEKMHAFTPIFVPEKKAEATGAKPAPKEKTFADDDAKAVSDATKGAAKKRIGDLASIVTKKGAGKTKDMTQVRADEELKFASTVMGRVLYSPSKRKRIYSGAGKKTEITEIKDSKRVVQMYNSITAADLANKLSAKFDTFQNDCLEMNLLVKKDDYIGLKLASEISSMYDYRVENKAFDEDKVIGKVEVEDKSSLPLRNPIITVMGHVDHGKTTLLDYIRKEKVTSGEAGGITQHIGAYSVPVGKSTLTFLDTPGHAAFASMRQRGANLTDIVVLVVAADDGVMPQTKQSINFAKNAGTPILIAINKMDKEGANPERIKQELTEFELVSEEWGGDTMFCNISALNGEGIDELLEAIKLQAEMLDLRESHKGKAEGIIIESKIESGRGPVATVLIQKGTLKKGDSVVVGECYGRARTLMDHAGKNVNQAGPSIPVQILGIDSPPSPGDILNVVKSEREARKIVENRVAERKALANVSAPQVASLEDFFANADVETGEKKILNLVIRSDVQGSYEAICDALEGLGNDEVGINIIAGGVGAISDNDVNMAINTNGYIIGFNMRPLTSARKIAEQNGVDVRTYSIIYELIEDVTLALEGMLEPEKIEKYIGRAEVRDTFSIPKVGTVAGCGVVDGKIERGCHVRLLRDGKIMYDGKLSTLKRFKDEVKEVSNGYECGMALEGYNDIKASDLIEAYMLEEKKRKLENNQIL